MFYRNAQGSEPVRVWLRGLGKEDRQEIGSDIMRVQWSGSFAMPTVRPLGKGLYEVRTSSAGKAFRVFFCVEGKALVLLHGFMKKMRKTPTREIEIARLRQQVVEKGGKGEA